MSRSVLVCLRLRIPLTKRVGQELRLLNIKLQRQFWDCWNVVVEVVVDRELNESS